MKANEQKKSRTDIEIDDYIYMAGKEHDNEGQPTKLSNIVWDELDKFAKWLKEKELTKHQ